MKGYYDHQTVRSILGTPLGLALFAGRIRWGGAARLFLQRDDYEFGYLVANSDLTGGPRSYTSGIDNWSVTLNNATPEPSSLALCCAGGLLIAIGRLRKRGRKSLMARISA